VPACAVVEPDSDDQSELGPSEQTEVDHVASAPPGEMSSVAAPAASELVSWLAGSWAVERAVNGVPGAFVGIADFVELCDGTMRWHESGRLRLDQFDGRACRTLIIVATDDGHEVRFDDGRAFHPLDLSTGHTEVVHLCGADRYHGIYSCGEPGELHVCWNVIGPGRDDEIISRYLRLSHTAAADCRSGDG
jgi:Family of unknown function (DUF6314)